MSFRQMPVSDLVLFDLIYVNRAGDVGKMTTKRSLYFSTNHSMYDETMVRIHDITQILRENLLNAKINYYDARHLFSKALG